MYFVPFISFIIFTLLLLFLLLVIQIQIRGHIRVASSCSPPAHYGSSLSLLSREKTSARSCLVHSCRIALLPTLSALSSRFFFIKQIDNLTTSTGGIRTPGPRLSFRCYHYVGGIRWGRRSRCSTDEMYRGILV